MNNNEQKKLSIVYETIKLAIRELLSPDNGEGNGSATVSEKDAAAILYLQACGEIVSALTHCRDDWDQFKASL